MPSFLEHTKIFVPDGRLLASGGMVRLLLALLGR